MRRAPKPSPPNTTSPGCTTTTTKLIADPDIDAIYNPLPNGLHGKWTRAALEAGKHVLCEKPFTANAAEAREIAELAATVGPGGDGGLPLSLPPFGFADRGDHRVGGVGHAAAGGGHAVLPTADVLRHPVQLCPCRRRDDGRRVLHGAHGPHLWRFNPGSRFGTGEIARSRDRPGHDGRIAVCRRTHRPDPLLDVVAAPAGYQCQSGRGPGRAECAQSRGAPAFSSALGPNSQRKPGRAFWAPRFLCVSARRFRRRGAARRTVPRQRRKTQSKT